MTSIMRPDGNKARQRLARSNRRRLRRSDGTVYLERWGFEIPLLGGIYIHRLDSADPGEDLHDHPWWFGSLILRGSYWEERSQTRDACNYAFEDAIAPERSSGRGDLWFRRPRSWRTTRLDVAHRIIRVDGPCWTLVVHGPERREWGFYTPAGFLTQSAYATTVAGTERGLADDLRNEPVGQFTPRSSR